MRHAHVPCHTSVVSWVIALLLALYAVVRVCLKVRGELRYRASALETSGPRPALEAPDGLEPPFDALFEDTRHLSETLHRATQVLERVLMTDPDAPLGEIRDERYRRQVLESWNAMQRWRSRYEDLAPDQVSTLEQRGEDGRPLVGTMAHIEEPVFRARRSRPLEAFPVQEVRDMFDRLRYALTHSDRLCEGMITAARDPYRGVVTKGFGAANT